MTRELVETIGRAAAATGPACPQNWYLLAPTRELLRGGILERSLGTTEIVLFRGRDSGRAVAFAAHCAHAGCHLRHGAVVGDGLRCALHHRVIRADGAFVARDGSVLGGTAQPSLPVIERLGCIFVFAGERATFDFPEPEMCAAGSIATRSLAAQSFPLPWSTLTSNGMDIDHLQAVHGRRMREPPTMRQLDGHRLRLDYCAAVSGRHLSDHAMKWISNNEIRASITCVGGSMMLVESQVGRHRSFVILSSCPDASGGSTVRAVVGIAGAPERMATRLSARVAAWLFHCFLEKDVGVLQQMLWHEPDVVLTQGDAFMRRLCDFFRGLPGFETTSERRKSELTPAETSSGRGPSLMIAAGVAGWR